MEMTPSLNDLNMGDSKYQEPRRLVPLMPSVENNGHFYGDY